jgi:hypothetical protein
MNETETPLQRSVLNSLQIAALKGKTADFKI